MVLPVLRLAAAGRYSRSPMTPEQAAPALPPDVPAGSGAWTEPGAHPVAPGVHRMPLPLPGDALKAVNVYAVEDGDRLALVDAGWHRDDSWEALRSSLREIGAEPGDIRQVLVTHIHHDHYGQAARIRADAGAVVLLGEGERRTLSTISDPEMRRSADADRLRQLVRSGASELIEPLKLAMEHAHAMALGLWELPDVLAPDAYEIELQSRVLHVVATPGHTRGHISFLDPEQRLLFAGDHVLPHITPSLGVEPWGGEGTSLVDFITSLLKVRSLAVTRVLPAHGPDFEGLRERVDALLEHHATRLEACIAALRSGSTTAYEVAHQLLWTRRGRSYEELDLPNRLLALTETVAHLELLAVQGTAVAREEGDLRLYELSRSGGPGTLP